MRLEEATDAQKHAQKLAALHANAFAARAERAWSAQEFADLLAQKNTHAFVGGQDDAQGFILLQNQPDGAEILTLAVLPAARRGGLARALMAHAQKALKADKLWLDVAEDNEAALALYAATGFRRTGRRSKYYKRAGNFSVDALLMERDRQKGENDEPESI
ncbi:MAG: GNAT family N-acetyltransferase [Alphaproteobacteria bacterium]|nr:GNAT family N-acetyltransferase [Alphaproteobacteria bacterium]